MVAGNDLESLKYSERHRAARQGSWVQGSKSKTPLKTWPEGTPEIINERLLLLQDILFSVGPKVWRFT